MPVAYLDPEATAICEREGGCHYGDRKGVVVYDGVRFCARCSNDVHGICAWATSPGMGELGGLVTFGVQEPDDLDTYNGPIQAGGGSFQNNDFQQSATYDIVACFLLEDGTPLWMTLRATGSYIRQSGGNKARIMAALDAVGVNQLHQARATGLIYWRVVA